MDDRTPVRPLTSDERLALIDAELVNIRGAIEDNRKRNQTVQRFGLATLAAIFVVTVAALGITILLAANAAEQSRQNRGVIRAAAEAAQRNASLEAEDRQAVEDFIAREDLNRETLNDLARRLGLPTCTAPPRQTPRPNVSSSARPSGGTPRVTPRPTAPATPQPTAPPSTPRPSPTPTPCPLPICLP